MMTLMSNEMGVTQGGGVMRPSCYFPRKMERQIASVNCVVVWLILGWKIVEPNVTAKFNCSTNLHKASILNDNFAFNLKRNRSVY